MDGLKVMVSPERGWEEVATTPSLGPLFLTYALLALVPLVGRMVGHLLMEGGWTLPLVLLDALLYPVLAFLMVVLLGVGVAVLADKFSPGSRTDEAVRLAFLSSTPLFVAGFLFLVPVAAVHLAGPLLALAYCGHLLFLGSHQLLGARPDRSVVVLSLVFGLWSLLFVLVLQVGLPYLVNRPC